MTRKQILECEILNTERALRYAYVGKDIYGYMDMSIKWLEEHMEELLKELEEIKND